MSLDQIQSMFGNFPNKKLGLRIMTPFLSHHWYELLIDVVEVNLKR